jgi:RNA polymerase sigma factor (sigma-70 family)
MNFPLRSSLGKRTFWKEAHLRATNRRRAAAGSKDGPAGVPRVLRALRRLGPRLVPAPDQRQYHKHNRIETAARNRLGLPLAFADCEDYDRVDERMAASELGPALHSAVEGLPVPQRHALELRIVQQLSYDEVAGRLGCSQNAARLRVSRALRALTVALGTEGTTG